MTTTYTFAQYRARCAQELGDFYQGSIALGFGPSQGTETTQQLQDTTAWPLVGTDAIYQDYFILRPDAISSTDNMRYVQTHVPQSGILNPDKPWTNPIGTGVTFEKYELSAVLRPDFALNCINQALKRCLVVTEFTLPAIVNVTRHSLATAAPWLADKDFVRAVGYLTPSDLREQVDPYIYNPVFGRAVQYGSVVYLDHPGRTFNGTETIYVSALKPAYYEVTGGAGFNISSSVQGYEAATCYIDPEWLAAAFLVEAWRQYGHALDAASNQRLLRDRYEAADWFSDLTAINLKVPPLEFKLVDNFGPRPSGWGPSH